MNLEFTVEEKHILKGKPRQAYHCAVAKCLQEAYPMASVSGQHITVEDDGKEYTWQTRHIPLNAECAKVGEFVEGFDNIESNSYDYGKACIPEKRELYGKWKDRLTFDLGEHTRVRKIV